MLLLCLKICYLILPSLYLRIVLKCTANLNDRLLYSQRHLCAVIIVIVYSSLYMSVFLFVKIPFHFVINPVLVYIHRGFLKIIESLTHTICLLCDLIIQSIDLCCNRINPVIDLLRVHAFSILSVSSCGLGEKSTV